MAAGCSVGGRRKWPCGKRILRVRLPAGPVPPLPSARPLAQRAAALTIARCLPACPVGHSGDRLSVALAAPKPSRMPRIGFVRMDASAESASAMGIYDLTDGTLRVQGAQARHICAGTGLTLPHLRRDFVSVLPCGRGAQWNACLSAVKRVCGSRDNGTGRDGLLL